MQGEGVLGSGGVEDNENRDEADEGRGLLGVGAGGSIQHLGLCIYMDHIMRVSRFTRESKAV